MQEPQSPTPSRSRLVFPQATLAEWISALASVATLGVGVWAFFFSSASQALVDYLHSELASRNNKIISLEAQEARLHLAVSQREAELSSLGKKTAELQGDLAQLSSQRERLQQQISQLEVERSALTARVAEAATDLLRSQFSMVREKLVGKLTSTLVVTWPLRLSDELYSAQGIRPRKATLWGDYLQFLRDEADKLASTEKELGKIVIEKFVNHCGHLSNVSIDIPALKAPNVEVDYRAYAALSDDERKSYDAEIARKRREVSQKFDALNIQIQKRDQEIESCLRSVVQ